MNPSFPQQYNEYITEWLSGHGAQKQPPIRVLARLCVAQAHASRNNALGLLPFFLPIAFTYFYFPAASLLASSKITQSLKSHDRDKTIKKIADTTKNFLVVLSLFIQDQTMGLAFSRLGLNEFLSKNLVALYRDSSGLFNKVLAIFRRVYSMKLHLKFLDELIQSQLGLQEHDFLNFAYFYCFFTFF